MSELRKDMFIALVTQQICEHPDWMADLQLAIQNGVATRLNREYEEKSDLAAALLPFFHVNKPNRFITKLAIKYPGWMLKGLYILRDMYKGAGIYEPINDVIEEVETANLRRENGDPDYGI